MYTTVRKRRNTIIRNAGEILLFGLLYYLLHTYTGLGIPCPIRLLTGYLCPGCGVTRMAVSLIRGDISAAYAYNPFVLTVLPLLGIWSMYRTHTYIQTGKTDFSLWEIFLLAAILLGAVIFTIYRNM